MKLDAAAQLRSDRSFRIFLVLSLSFLLFTSAASALEGIVISGPGAADDSMAEASAPAPGACPRLIQIKYPFLRCSRGEIGQSDANETWENSRRLPLQSRWIEGNGYFGPSLNQDQD